MGLRWIERNETHGAELQDEHQPSPTTQSAAGRCDETETRRAGRRVSAVRRSRIASLPPARAPSEPAPSRSFRWGTAGRDGGGEGGRARRSGTRCVRRLGRERCAFAVGKRASGVVGRLGAVGGGEGWEGAASRAPQLWPLCRGEGDRARMDEDKYPFG